MHEIASHACANAAEEFILVLALAMRQDEPGRARLTMRGVLADVAVLTTRLRTLAVLALEGTTLARLFARDSNTHAGVFVEGQAWIRGVNACASPGFLLARPVSFRLRGRLRRCVFGRATLPLHLEIALSVILERLVAVSAIHLGIRRLGFDRAAALPYHQAREER